MKHDEKRKQHKKKPNKDIRYDEELRVSKHGCKRARERLGLPKEAVKRNAEKALKYGIERTDASGPFRRYLDFLYFDYGTANNLRVYNRYIYIFCNEVLVTIMCVPRKYWDTSDTLQRRKKRMMEDNHDKHKPNSRPK